MSNVEVQKIYEQFDLQDKGFLRDHELLIGGKNEKWLTGNACIFLPNIFRDPARDAKSVISETNSAIQRARAAGVPGELIEGLLKLSIQQRTVLVSNHICTGEVHLEDIEI